MLRTVRILTLWLGLVGMTLGQGIAFAEDADVMRRGKAIYVEQCATCHGDRGEGVEGAYDSPLVGDLSWQQLTQYVDETMPEGDAETCVGEDAELVTRYLIEAFYSREAQLRNRPPEIAFSRLTVDQYQNSLIDLMRPLLNNGRLTDRHGLRAVYYSKGKLNGKHFAFQRDEAKVDVDFGDGVPADQGFDDPEQFAVEWSGGLIAPETGTYEIIVTSDNGFRVYLNREPWEDEALIDNWVDSNEHEYRATAKLRAGRVYPLSVQFFKYKEPSASIQLQWKPPHSSQQVISAANLTPEWFPRIVQVETDFPPDDRSVGYERGTSVSTQWDRATTRAAVEALEFVRRNLREIEGLTKKQRKELRDLPPAAQAAQARTRLRKLSERLVETAFRRPPTDREIRFFIDRNFNAASSAEAALDRVVLLTLKSPQFLYVPRFDATPDPFDIATRLSLTLYDSLPDTELTRAANAEELIRRQVIYDQAWRLVHDQRTRTKVRQFFHEWLETERAGMGGKDAEVFPGFDDDLVASLRQSLDRMVSDVVWSDASDFRELFTSDKFYVDQRLAEFYGLSEANEETFSAISFEPGQRSGLLTHPFLMAGFAYHRNTSPIHRGVFVAKRLLGRTLKSPPVEVEPLEEDFDSKMTTRQRVAHQTKGKMCQSCHSMINPLGFSFENFDAVGRYREREKQQPVNTTSVYVTPTGESVTLNNARDLADFLISSESAHRNFVEQLFQHMTKQPLAAYGRETSDQLVAKFRGSGFHIKNLLVEIAVTAATHQLEQYDEQGLKKAKTNKKAKQP